MTAPEQVVVSPGDGQTLAELAKALIGLAGDPHEVVWAPRRNGFLVPQTVAAAYAATVTAPDTEPGSAATGPTSTAAAAAPRQGRAAAPTRTSRGRNTRTKKTDGGGVTGA